MIRWLLAALLAAAPMMAAAQTGARSFDTRLQHVEDELAIRRILIDYAAFLDGRDYASYAALFTADGEWANGAGSHKGRDAIRAMLESTLGPAGAPNRSNYHIISNPRIDIDGDRATATSRYLFVMRGPNGQPVPSLAGIYRDELVRQNGAWKIKRRVADDIMPTPEEWKKIVPTPQGAK
ncbi:MAG TPA: nuclear transport factor 2 family protein [Sphingomonadaceae bacterium]|nr:nuclear transport factor 2 family protein [Sphingomonadaceae bacterium]